MADRMDNDVATATIEQGISLSKGLIWTIAIMRDRPHLPSGRLGKGQKGGTMVADSLIELLRMTADYMEQEDLDTLWELSDALQAVRSRTDA